MASHLSYSLGCIIQHQRLVWFLQKPVWKRGKKEGGHIVYTRELGARHISMKTQQDGQKGRVKPSKGQTEQRRLTTLLFNVNVQK